MNSGLLFKAYFLMSYIRLVSQEHQHTEEGGGGGGGGVLCNKYPSFSEVESGCSILLFLPPLPLGAPFLLLLACCVASGQLAGAAS